MPLNIAMPSQELLLHWIQNLCLAGAWLGCLYLMTAAILTLRFAREHKVERCVSSAVTILKPLHGSEPHLFERLSSFCSQNYDGQVQLVFGTHDRADPAIQVLRRLEAAFPEQPIALKIDPHGPGPNPKISNLVNMMELAQHDILVVADSDIQVGPHYLAKIVAELQRPGVGAITCLYHGIAGTGVWSQVSAMFINSHFLPGVVMALSLGLAQPCFGATIAMRRQMLTRIGGFSAFADFLAEDYAIGKAVRVSGHEVVIPPLSVGHVCFENDFKSLLARQIRIARTIKSIDPIGYAGSIITHPLPLALVGALLGSSSCLFLAALALCCRTALCIASERAFRLESQHYWLIPIQDLISFIIYVVSYFGASVTWHDRRYRLVGHGSLVQTEE